MISQARGLIYYSRSQKESRCTAGTVYFFEYAWKDCTICATIVGNFLTEWMTAASANNYGILMKKVVLVVKITCRIITVAHHYIKIIPISAFKLLSLIHI